MREELARLICEAGLDDIREKILVAAESSIVFQAAYPVVQFNGYMDQLRRKHPEAASFASFEDWDRHLNDTIPLGSTRAGGLPDLHNKVEWPQFEIHTDCAREDLHRRRAPAPHDIATDWAGRSVYHAVPVLKCNPTPSLPAYGTDWWRTMTQEDDGREDQLSNLADLLADLHDGTQAAMQLGGHPSMDCIEWQVESGWLEPGDWTVLLEVGSVGTMMWSDAGFLEFLVRREDRTRGDFSRVHADITSS